MKKIIYSILFLTLTPFLGSCSSENKPDYEKPVTTDYNAMAVKGVNDMIENFWIEGVGIRPTWGGIEVSDAMPEKRGQLWERAMMVFPMYQLYKINNDQNLLAKLKFEAKRLKDLYEESILTQAGHYYNTSIDDCGWNAMMYMNFYNITKDNWYINIAKGLINNAVIYWTDPADNKLFYSGRNPGDRKSVYACGLVFAMLDIYLATGEREWLDKVIYHFGWMDSMFARTDGIYWADATINGPLGDFDRIAESSSVSFLAGNHAMCLIAKRLYDITKDESYLRKVIKVSTGLYLKYNHNRNNIYINDRDAWANGTYVCDFAKEIAFDPSLNMGNSELLLGTARSIVRTARTADGYYSGSWEGPIGEGSPWRAAGSIPEQIMTSGSTVNMLVGAAVLDKLLKEKK